MLKLEVGRLLSSSLQAEIVEAFLQAISSSQGPCFQPPPTFNVALLGQTESKTKVGVKRNSLLQPALKPLSYR